MYKKYNNRKKHNGRYIISCILLVVVISLAVVYSKNNYQDQKSPSIDLVKKTIGDEIRKIEPIMQPMNTKPIISHVDNSDQTNDNLPSTHQPTDKTYSLDELKQIALDDINNYRLSNGVSQITMENAKASQVWADYLLSEGCIAHREGNSGPMQRYVDNGDKLYMVYENVSGGYGTNWANPDDSIKQANSEMMNNDMDQNNAHRNNILNPNHLSVSIGIAYNSDKLILVEDFQEQVYANWKSFDMAYDDSKSCW